MSDKPQDGNTRPPIKNLEVQAEHSLQMAGRIRGYISTQYPDDPLNHIFTALLLIAAEIAHSQQMSNVAFRRTARDVYNIAQGDYNRRTKGGTLKPDYKRKDEKDL